MSGEAVDDDCLESEVDELLALTRRFPHTLLEQALMRAVARVGAADAAVSCVTLVAVCE